MVVEYSGDQELDMVLDSLEHCGAFLTAGVVSKDIQFQQKVGRLIALSPLHLAE